MYDNRLLIAAQQGDEAAFAALYDRNVEGIYDFCWALTGDTGEASRLVGDVFALAARHLRDIVDASQLRPWLLAIARDRVLTEDEAGTLRSGWGAATGSAGGAEPLGNNELRRWVRSAAATLALADQVVIELGLRHDLDGDQLAAAIGCPPERVEAIFAQVEAEAEHVLGTLVLARQGRGDCPQLAALLEGWDQAPSADTTDIVAEHAPVCERCSRRLAVAHPLDLLGAAPPAPVPPALRNEVLDLVAAELARVAVLPPLAEPAEPDVGPAAGALAMSAAEPATTVAAASAPPVPAPDPLGDRHLWTSVPIVAGRDRRPWIPILAVAAIVVVVVALLALLLHPSSHTRVASAHLNTTTSQAPTTVAQVPVTPPGTIAPIASTTTSTTSTTLPASRLQLDTTRVDLGATATTAEVSLSDAGDVSARWRATTAVPWLTVNPASGLLQPGSAVGVTLTIDRAAVPAGSFDQRLSFLPSDNGGVPASLSVVGTNSGSSTTSTTPGATSTTIVTNGPSIGAVSASPATIQSAPCSNDQSVVSAAVTDSAAVTSVVVTYSLPDGRRGSTTMSRAATEWSAAIGGSRTSGTISYQVTASDSAGLTRTSPPQYITVTTCAL